MSDEKRLWRSMEETYSDSPIHNALGLSLRVLDHGKTEVSFDGSESAVNRRGTPAGGTLTEMIDSAAVQAVRTRLSEEDRVTTIELKVNFVRAAGKDAQLTATGTVEYEGRTTAVGVGRVEDPGGRLVAIGLVTVSIRRAS